MKKEKKNFSDTQLMVLATALLVIAVVLVVNSPLFPKSLKTNILPQRQKPEFNLEAFGAFDGCSRYGTYKKAFANCKNGRSIQLGNGKECVSIERLTREAVKRCNISCQVKK
jgi:hypothetical protein